MKQTPFRPFPYLTNENLVLRELQPPDAATIFTLRTDKEINKFIKRDFYKSIDEASKFIIDIKENLDTGKAVVWAIESKQQAKLMGTVCIWNLNKSANTGELGYDLLTEQHGQGVMSAAVELVLDYGFNQMELDRIDAYTHKENMPSIALLTKMGFTHDKSRKDEKFPDNIIFILKRPNH